MKQSKKLINFGLKFILVLHISAHTGTLLASLGSLGPMFLKMKQTLLKSPAGFEEVGVILAFTRDSPVSAGVYFIKLETR